MTPPREKRKDERSDLWATQRGTVLHATATCCSGRGNLGGGRGHRTQVRDHHDPSYFNDARFTLCWETRHSSLSVGERFLAKHETRMAKVDEACQPSPEADEQVGGEEQGWMLWVCDYCGDWAEVEPGGTCEVCEAGTIRIVEVVPASSSIPTEKVREVVEWMRDKAKMARAERDHHADQGRIDYCDGQQRAWDQTADRLSALVEGTEDDG